LIGTSATNSFAVTSDGGYYNFSVKAVSGTLKSDYSAGMSQTIDPIAPTNVALVPGTLNTTDFDVSWTASVTPGVSYEIFRDWVSLGTVAAGVTTFKVTGCPTPNVNYFIAVKSILGGVKSFPSVIGNIKTGPAAPTALVATAVEVTTATLTWTASATAGVTYEVYQDGVKIGTTAAGILTYNVTGLTANTSYSFNVKALLSGAYSTASEVVPVKTKISNALNDVYSNVNIYVVNSKIVLDLNGLTGAQTITVYNLQGKSIINRKANGGEKLTLANNLMKGVYVVKVQGAEATIVNKLIVK